MAFDPKRARDSGAGSSAGIPASTYLLAIMWAERRESKAGKPYERCKFVVISGAAKDKSFYDQIGLDTSNEGVAFRLGLLLGELNGDVPIDLDDDKAFREAVMFKPFKAVVNRTTNNGYVNNGIARILVGDKVTEEEREAMEQWKIEREAARDAEANGGGSDDLNAPEDDVPHPADGGGGGIDNDIPF